MVITPIPMNVHFVCLFMTLNYYQDGEQKNDLLLGRPFNILSVSIFLISSAWYQIQRPKKETIRQRHGAGLCSDGCRGVPKALSRNP